MSTKLIVGLRNPGSQYAGTRHNIGGDVVEAVSSGAVFKRARLGIRADVTKIRFGDTRVVLALPRTFMNECGQSIAPLVRYERIDYDRLLVVHDDIDLPFGKIKVQFGGGAGGHNGIRSLTGSLDTGDFWRLKIGVGRPPGRVDPADYVLGRFAKVERATVEDSIIKAVQVVEVFSVEDGEAARQKAGELND
ncbi:MAG TPA: aminoacyl-tRNA hydrolase [Acidimicrobiia bacterium]|nr:aminoacyl-tRNA hydrolase [Acidimicrobiia bacterium]